MAEHPCELHADVQEWIDEKQARRRWRAFAFAAFYVVVVITSVAWLVLTFGFGS